MGGRLGYVWGVRVVRGGEGGSTWGGVQIFAIFLKESETGCVQENWKELKNRKLEQKLNKN